MKTENKAAAGMLKSVPQKHLPRCAVLAALLLGAFTAFAGPMTATNVKCQVARHSGATVFFYTSVWQAISNARDGDVVRYSGVFEEKQQNTANSSPMTLARNNLTLIGDADSWIRVYVRNVPYWNDCAMNLASTTNLTLINVRLSAVHTDANNSCYNVWLNCCNNARIYDCVFESIVRQTNNTMKTFVATENASNIVMCGGAIITIDATGSNFVYHAATHNAQPSLFSQVNFIGTTNLYSVGPALFCECVVSHTGVISNAILSKKDAIRQCISPEAKEIIAKDIPR